jgi:hypothetical protein
LKQEQELRDALYAILIVALVVTILSLCGCESSSEPPTAILDLDAELLGEGRYINSVELARLAERLAEVMADNPGSVIEEFYVGQYPDSTGCEGIIILVRHPARNVTRFIWCSAIRRK